MKTVCLILIAILCVSCSQKLTDPFPVSQEDYSKEIQIWKNGRIKSLTAPEGWLSVIGLHWLEEGKNSIGSKPGSDILLPEFASEIIGDIYLDKDNISFKSFGEGYVSHDDKRFINGILESDVNGNATKLSHKSLVFYVIKRGDKYALRVKDKLARARYTLKEIPCFPINQELRIVAEVKSLDSDKSVWIKDVTGIQTEYKIEAELIFTYKGKKHRLLAFDGGKDSYFIVFNDMTTGNETYGGGRFVYVRRPLADADLTVIDFNLAHNPPCVFTDFATCPLPPIENYLKFEVTAGEKNPDGVH